VHARFGRGRPETYRREPARRRAPTLRDEEIAATIVAMKAQETMREYAALQVVVKRLLHITRQLPFIGITRMVQKRTKVLPYKVVEDRPLGAARFVARTWEAHPRRRIAATYLRLAT
jgi:hypothetical protein